MEIFKLKLGSHKLLFVLLLLFILSGCKRKNEPEIKAPEIPENESATKTKEVRLIFYNMDLPTEMARLFERVGANYTPKILNSADNFSRYNEKLKIALNIGLYGVDLSYCRIFGQTAATAKYFSAIQILYEKLGIPDYYYEDIIKGLEKYFNDKDSLARFASDMYDRADLYLRENENDAYAAMIVTGGWVRIYLACKIAENNPEDTEIKERIAGQKYSLNSLVSLLSNYQEDIVITQYILMLKNLKKSFDKVNIYYYQENFRLDTISKLISSSDYEINLSPDVLDDINRMISEIRSEIVN